MMNGSLRKEILQKCRKTIVSEESYDEEEEIEESGEMSDKFEGTENDLPFQDILAEKRRKYSAKEEFIYLLYNDVLKYFVTNWKGRFLRKKPWRKLDSDSGEESDGWEEIEETHNYEDKDIKGPAKNGTNSEEYLSDKTKANFNLPWKLILPDEFADITFINGNTYSGCISRKMMEGKGVYRWSNGAQYKVYEDTIVYGNLWLFVDDSGEFEQNLMHGRGLLEWSSNCWYEGDFANGHRHGRGLLVNGEDHFMYTGQWSSDYRHGKGYCRFGDNGSYDGDWVMEKMCGVGLRIYPSGARYVGQWKDGLRHGIGTMVWTNGNVYRGEWKCGAMEGYGEYVWEGFFNKTFTWPQEASYTGDWRRGIRHGKGRLKLKSVGGAEYSGYWKDNKKHGQGIIIGNNGEKFEADPLFLNDILVSPDVANGTLQDQSEIEDKSTCVRTSTSAVKEVKPLFLEKPTQLGKTPVTPIMKPEQFPSLSYYLTRLLDPKRLEPRSVPSVSSGKCYNCDNPSCSCLGPHSNGARMSEEIINTETVDAFKSNWENEQRWLQNCLTLHIFRLRQIYKDYAKLFAKSAPQCNLAMSRLCLWQLWQDCCINKKGFSLSEIDNYMAKNESAFVKDPYYPFEKIEIWQFLHALLEVSWHLYTKNDDIENREIHGKLAGGLHKLLKNDVYPHVENHVGSFYHEHQNLLPLNCVFELYQSIGRPCSAKDFLRATCALKGTPSPQTSATTDSIVKHFADGINAVTIGGKVSYLLKVDEIFSPSRGVIETGRKYKNNLFHELLVFRQLGAKKMVEIIASVCPGIKDSDNGIIINMDYELTFLEFYEITLQATKELLILRKEAEKEMQGNKIAAETVSIKNNL